MLDPSSLGFRPLELGDLPLLHRWRNAPHVLQWWKEPTTFEALVAEYTPRITGHVPTQPFVILYGAKPIGYIQTYRIRDYPDYSRYVAETDDAAGVDLF